MSEHNSASGQEQPKDTNKTNKTECNSSTQGDGKKQDFEPADHRDLMNILLEEIKPLNFRDLAAISDEKEKLIAKHYIVICIEQLLCIARKKNWGLCRNNNFIYLFNGEYWKTVNENDFQAFLGAAAEKMGTDVFSARYHSYRELLFKQFLATANLTKPEPDRDLVLISLKNGVYEIGKDRQALRPAQAADFLTYQLPFEYDPTAEAPLFQAYLNKVQPDISRQMVLSEYIGYLFIKQSVLKLEKTLILYGGGANGKSVFFEVINALLGRENVSSYSLQSLTDDKGYTRAMLENKLMNYAPEISGKLQTAFFKQLVSGEPIEARLPYGNPTTITDYAKLIFNCNELPRDIEHTMAYFRRFLIVPFDVSIPENEQDRELPAKIISNELAGVFNWVLEGLRRLLEQKRFTNSEAVDSQLNDFKNQSDSVQMFLIDEGYKRSQKDFVILKETYNNYKRYCDDFGHRPCSQGTFSDRLRTKGVEIVRKSAGRVAFMKRNLIPTDTIDTTDIHSCW